MFDVYDMIVSIPGVFIAIAFHEFAHAYAAKLMGDDTAEKSGRLTVNPVSHMDILGTLMLIVAGFGWAKPIPVNETKFKNTRIGILVVSLAGVTMNIILAMIFAIIYSLLITFNVDNDIVLDILYNITVINIVFASFNILPIPPLDGFKVILAFVSSDIRYKTYQYERYGMILLMVLIWTGTIDFLLSPVASVIVNFIVDTSIYVTRLIA